MCDTLFYNNQRKITYVNVENIHYRDVDDFLKFVKLKMLNNEDEILDISDFVPRKRTFLEKIYDNIWNFLCFIVGEKICKQY